MGKPLSEETKRKISEAKKGKPTWNKGMTGIFSKETRRKMGAKNIGKKRTKEQKEYLRLLNTGRKVKKETREKITAGLIRYYETHTSPKKGVPRKKETREKIRNSSFGKVLSKETKEKIKKSKTGVTPNKI